MLHISQSHPVISFDIVKGTMFLIFIVSPFVDAITGYMINTGLVSIGSIGSASQLFRFILTFCLLCQIKKKSHFYTTLTIILWITIIELINLLLHNRLDWFILGLIYSFKLSFGFIIYFVIKEYLDCKYIDSILLKTYIIKSISIYVIIILISDLLGISSPAYITAGVGSKGIFADGNGMGVFLGVGMLIIIERFFEQKKTKYLILSVLTGYVLLGLRSKAGLLFFLTGLILLFINSKRIIKILAVGGLTISFFLWHQPIIETLEEMFSLMIWRFSRSESLWEIILGGREIYLHEALSYDYSTLTQILKLILGGGYRLTFRDPSVSKLSDDGIFIIEADLFDTFFMYGIIGFIIYVAVFIKGFLYRPSVLTAAWFILFIHSALAGHVISSGIAMIIMPCVLLLIENCNSKKKLKKLIS